MQNFKKTGIKFDAKKLRQATNMLFTKVSWRHHVVKGLSLTQIPGDPTSAYGEKLRGVFYQQMVMCGLQIQEIIILFLMEVRKTGFILLQPF